MGTHSRVAHATSRNTQTREPSDAELLPTGIDPTNMDSAITSTCVGYVESKCNLRPLLVNHAGCMLDRIPARSNDTCLCRKFHRNLRPSPVTLNGSLDTTSAKRLGFPSFGVTATWAAVFGVTGNTPSFPDRGLGSGWDRLKTDPSQIHDLDHSWGNTQAVAARCDYVGRFTVRSDSKA